MYLKKIPRIISTLFKSATFFIKNSESYYLTFDDGPHPGSTPIILDKLKQKGIKATFFCSGYNVKKHPDLLQNIRSAGHSIGHHGYSHLNGWTTKLTDYISDIDRAANEINSTLFRPPYGKLTWQQYQILKRKYEIILWDNMPGDFDTNLQCAVVLKNFYTNLSPGSIIVLHDKPQSIENVCAIIDSIDVVKYESLNFESLN